jgi:golgi SNAP receptor complex member 2
MNSLYTSGVRQTNSLQADMERLRNGDNSPALLGEYLTTPCTSGFRTTTLDYSSVFDFIYIGQISASLSAMQRTIDDYDSMTKREIIKAKQEKGQMYLLFF